MFKVVGYNPPLLCYPHNKSRPVEFPELENFTVGDQIGISINFCCVMFLVVIHHFQWFFRFIGNGLCRTARDKKWKRGVARAVTRLPTTSSVYGIVTFFV